MKSIKLVSTGAALFAAAPLAWCHAVLLQGTPAAGAVIKGPVIPITLRFNSRIDGKRSRLSILSMEGKEQSIELAPQSSPDTISGQIRAAKPGKCRVRWQVLASDGHITRGEIVFQVK